MIPGRDFSRRLQQTLEFAFESPDKARFLARLDQDQRDLERVLAKTCARPAYTRLMALRIANLVVSRFHFHHRHAVLASRPIELMVDPANNCHLSCPGCLHTANPNFTKAFDWPGGLLADEPFDQLLREYGPTAWGLVFYNWGEPLLNKRTPSLIRRSKRLLLQSSVSTNLSLKFDVEALVASGLNFLYLSLDGASQETYGRFRRGGDFELCIENIRLLVEARKRLGSSTPFIFWRFLTFEHNVHEVERAEEMARRLGVDQFSVTTPFAVDWDDPAIRIARSEREGTYLLRQDASFRGRLDDWRDTELDEEAIERAFELSWLERLGEDPDPAESGHAESPACHWLYQNLTLDARARLFPCCMAPELDRHKVYGDFMADPTGAFNAEDFKLSRLGFADRQAFETLHAQRGGGEPPYCAICTEKPEMTYTLERDVRRELRLAVDAGVVSDEIVDQLVTWPASR